MPTELWRHVHFGQVTEPALCRELRELLQRGARGSRMEAGTVCSRRPVLCPEETLGFQRSRLRLSIFTPGHVY